MEKSDYIFGIRAILEAIDSGKTVDKVLIRRDLGGDLAKELLDKVKKYVVDDEFCLSLYGKTIHIENYTKIISLEDNRVVVLSLQKKVTILGNHLHVSRLLDNEMLLNGEVEKIEVENV